MLVASPIAHFRKVLAVQCQRALSDFGNPGTLHLFVLRSSANAIGEPMIDVEIDTIQQNESVRCD